MQGELGTTELGVTELGPHLTVSSSIGSPLTSPWPVPSLLYLYNAPPSPREPFFRYIYEYASDACEYYTHTHTHTHTCIDVGGLLWSLATRRIRFRMNKSFNKKKPFMKKEAIP